MKVKRISGHQTHAVSTIRGNSSGLRKKTAHGKLWPTQQNDEENE